MVLQGRVIEIMRKTVIFARFALQHQPSRKYPFKRVFQWQIVQRGREIWSDNIYLIGGLDRETLRNKPQIFETRKRAELEAFAQKLGRTDGEKALKAAIKDLLAE